jgi:hypothetical protein
MIPILTAYTFSIKSHHSYPVGIHFLHILSPIVPLYRLSIVSLYSRHCTFPIRIAYTITYKRPLYFDIHNVLMASERGDIIHRSNVESPNTSMCDE